MKKAELVFIPTPGMGHFVSIVEFAHRIIARDERFSVTILSLIMPFDDTPSHSYTDSISRSPKINLVQLTPKNTPQLDPSKTVEYSLLLLLESLVPVVKDALTHLLSTRSSDSPRLVGLVLDFFCTPMIDVGSDLGLPSYLFVTSGAGFLGLMLYLPTRHARVSSEYQDSDPEFTLPSFVNPVAPKTLPRAMLDKDGGGYTSYVKLAQRFRDAKGIIVNTFAELEPHAVNSFSDGLNPPVYTVGPVIDVDGRFHRGPDTSRAKPIMEWLDKQPPASVVFLCFGSMGFFSAPQVREIADGLERSGRRFLWSLREPPANGGLFFHGAGWTVAEVLPEGFVDRTAGRGLLCGWAPQVEVLGHAAVGGFVSHCGWNSILECVWSGVPVATWPLYAEQELNAFNLVREQGLAVELRLSYKRGEGGDGDLVTAEEIERAVRLLMDGDDGQVVRKKAREVGQKSRRAVMDGGSSFLSLGRFIEDVILMA